LAFSPGLKIERFQIVINQSINQSWDIVTDRAQISCPAQSRKLRAVAQVEVRNRIKGALRKRRLFLSFSLCLSRACLGKMSILMYKWRKKAAFLTFRSASGCNCVASSSGGSSGSISGGAVTSGATPRLEQVDAAEPQQQRLADRGELPRALAPAAQSHRRLRTRSVASWYRWRQRSISRG
jgi:hypothetical protein